jgi:calcium/calmodulin-dependent protein kinase I
MFFSSAPRAASGFLLSLARSSLTDLNRSFESRGKFYTVFELAPGGELFERMARRGAYPEAEARVIIRGLLGAISYLHTMLVVHRDVKPENILYRSMGDVDDFVLADLEFAHRLENEDDKIIGVIGTPGYAAPEVRLLAFACCAESYDGAENA